MTQPLFLGRGRRTLARRASVVAVGALTAVSLAACSDGDSGSGSSDRVSDEEVEAALQTEQTITFWTTQPGVEAIVDAFEKAHPAITVDIVAIGSEGPSTTLGAALEAGTGIPDVVQFPGGETAAFVLTDDLVDLSKFGADALESDYVPSAWADAAFADGVWGLPQDSGPVGSIYRSDIFEQAGLSDYPKTWDEFADAARQIKEATGSYITDFTLLEALSLPGQGGRPLIEWDGNETITLRVTSERAREVADFWQGLIDDDLVSLDPGFTDTWYQGIAGGKYASWAAAPAWAPTVLQGTAATTAGLWRAATLPQWDAGGEDYTTAGGSIVSIPRGAQHELAAYGFVKWVYNESGGTEATRSIGLFPTSIEALNDETWLSQPVDFFGGQEVNALYAKVAETTPSTVGPNPIAANFNKALQDEVFGSLQSGGTVWDGFQAWQASVKKFAESQGFTVVTE